jgi:hypothetical protein
MNRAFTVMTLLFYAMTAFRNPGYILGNQEIEERVMTI